MSLAERIESLYHQESTSPGQEFFDTFNELKRRLNDGSIRAAEAVEDGSLSGWKVNAWVKMGILLGFRIGSLEDMSVGGKLSFYDKNTFPLKQIRMESGVRLVPGGSSIRDGCS